MRIEQQANKIVDIELNLYFYDITAVTTMTKVRNEHVGLQYIIFKST